MNSIIKKSKLNLAILIVACGFISTQSTAEEIEIVGTGDGTQVLQAIGDAFNQLQPDIKVLVPKSIGSGGGIKAVGNNTNTIGRVAREIKDKEKPLGLTYQPFAKVPVVFFIHPDTGLTNLSTAQICDIYSGKVTNWQEVGGIDEKIRVVRRENGDSSLGTLQKTFPGFKDISMTEKSKIALKTKQAISIVEGKKGAIGFGPLDVAMNAHVQVLQIAGNMPTDANYPSFNTLALIFKSENKVGSLEKFIDFSTSPEAKTAIIAAHAVPIN